MIERESHVKQKEEKRWTAKPDLKINEIKVISVKLESNFNCAMK
jgi:hypothetical protein